MSSKILVVASRIVFGLLVVGGFALLIIITFAADRLGWGAPEKEPELEIELPPMPVSVQTVERERIEITDTYSGMIRPYERFRVAFEIGGRLVPVDDRTEPLDDGDRVRAGQVLAKLEERVLAARLKQAEAQLEEAESELNRAKQLSGSGLKAVSDSALQQSVTAVAVSAAAREAAEKALEDATLVAPVDALISKRYVKVGESVSPFEPVMDLIQVDRVLLVLGVPEAYVGDIQRGQTVHVELLARDRFRRKRPRLDGQVYRVAEAADDTTGLFEVEIIIPNPDGRLKPGLIALAHIVVDRREGYRVPLASAVHRDGKTLLFSVGGDGTARSFEVENWVDQGPDMILSTLPPEHCRVVVRGQHRLVDGRTVREVGPDDGGDLELTPETAVRAVGSR
jgi:RND family efflux transporter MFP subunit